MTRKGALATGALALGTAATTGAVTAQEDEEVLMYSYDFFPGQDFVVISQLQQSTTVSMLMIDDETVPEISSPDDFTGHVIRYSDGGDAAGITTFLFSEEVSLSEDDSGTLGTEPSMFSSDLNLLSSNLG